METPMKPPPCMQTITPPRPYYGTAHRASTPLSFFSLMTPPPPRSTLFPYTTLFRSLLVFLQVNQMPSPVSDSNPISLPLLPLRDVVVFRSEEHTSELQSRRDLVCRLLLEKKKTPWRGARRSCGASTWRRR